MVMILKKNPKQNPRNVTKLEKSIYSKRSLNREQGLAKTYEYVCLRLKQFPLPCTSIYVQLSFGLMNLHEIQHEGDFVYHCQTLQNQDIKCSFLPFPTTNPPSFSYFFLFTQCVHTYVVPFQFLLHRMKTLLIYSSGVFGVAETLFMWFHIHFS